MNDDEEQEEKPYIETREIKPCPFCGGKAVFNPTDDEDGYRAYIYILCQDCCARSDTITFHIFHNCGGVGSEWRRPYENQAIALWNKRI